MPHSALAFLDALNRPALIAMIHVRALPGTPRASEPVRAIMKTAVEEARTLAGGGADAVLLENMHDLPYLNRDVGPEIIASMTAVCAAVRGAIDLPLGVQILAGANRAAVAVAQAAGCTFVRCEGFVFAHVADEGLMPEADAGPLLRYRRMIAADHVAILADVKKKHAAHAITTDVDLAETARAAEFSGADGLIVTGTATGQPTDPDDLATVARTVKTPVFVGSGVTPDNLAALAPHAAGLIVGSHLKQGGHWANPIDPKRLAALRKAIDTL